MNDLVGKRLDGYVIVAVYEDMYFNGVVIGYKSEYKDNKISETWATWYCKTKNGELKFRHGNMTEKEAYKDFIDRVKNFME